MRNTDDIHTNDTRKPNDTDPSDAVDLPQNREGRSPPPAPLVYETKGAGVGLRPYFASAISTDSGATWSAPTLHV